MHGTLARRFISECDGHHKNALFSTKFKGSVNPLTRRRLQRFPSGARCAAGRGTGAPSNPGRLSFVLKNFSRVALRGIDRLRTGCIIAEHLEVIEGNSMPNHPVILKALCAGLVGCLLLPLGPLLFPYLDVPVLPFNVIEAVVGATLGFGIAEWIGSIANLSP